MRQHAPNGVTRDRCYAFILAYCRRYYLPPSVRDVAAGVGLASSSQAAYHIARLVAEGRLTRVGPEGASRAAVPVELLTLVTGERSAA